MTSDYGVIDRMTLANNANAREGRVQAQTRPTGPTGPTGPTKPTGPTRPTGPKKIVKTETSTADVDPFAAERAAQAAAQARADAAQAAFDATRNKTNREIFRQVMSAYFDLKTESSWIDSLFDSAKKYYDQDITGDAAVELLLREDTAPAQFKNRFSAYLNTNAKRTAAGMAPEFSSLADYIATERAYASKLSSYNAFKDLATQDNIKKFIENEVSIDEVGARIDNAYYAINTADQALKQQIKNQFPSLNDDDLARALVTGTTDSIQQKIRFGAAAIATEAASAGMQLESDIQDLAKQGITREEARVAAQKLARERQGIQQTARTFGQQIGQQELEQEAFGIKESATAKGLRSQARAQFGGQTGIVTGSLGRGKGRTQI